ncbi:tumor protein p63-regulated gene 1-like protein [Watersipora subatra]|uniref:tumor protein p63-regulated gene 1-like protein n=1 Tax=Watersipora subatra TaxID=2589382 RepID=UPI00355BDE8A
MEPAFADVSLSPNSERTEEGSGQATAASETPAVEVEATEGASGKAAPELTADKLYESHTRYIHNKDKFYTAREGVFEKALEDIKEKVVNPVADGPDVLGAWLLFEVDHWDSETEKVVVLTTESLLTVRYDFVPRRVYKFKRRALKDFDTVKAGDFVYPTYSLLSLSPDLVKRNCSGVRLMWNKGVEPGFLRRWNLDSTSMPWQTFTYHPLAFTDEGKGQQHYSVMNFTESVVRATEAAYSKHHPNSSLTVLKEPLEQNIYVGFPSQMHNQSFLGMSKDRGFLSF